MFFFERLLDRNRRKSDLCLFDLEHRKQLFQQFESTALLIVCLFQTQLNLQSLNLERVYRVCLFILNHRVRVPCRQILHQLSPHLKQTSNDFISDDHSHPVAQGHTESFNELPFKGLAPHSHLSHQQKQHSLEQPLHHVHLKVPEV